jgi:hypothetical protein
MDGLKVCAALAWHEIHCNQMGYREGFHLGQIVLASAGEAISNRLMSTEKFGAPGRI